MAGDRVLADWHRADVVALGVNGRVQVGNCTVDDKGAEAWRTSVDQPSTPAVLDTDGTAYFASGSRLYAVDAAGKTRWTFDADSPLNPPSLGASGVVMMTSPQRLYLLGTRPWHSEAQQIL